jgi:glyoxylase-like metal-dependent hydrolase (beta-lactamase superfamily II)
MTDVGDRSGVTSLDEVTTRVRADNPSPMTLTGTNTYVVADPGAGAAVVVDPGPVLPGHRSAIDSVLAAHSARVAAVVITHHHADHAEAVGWARSWGAPAFAFDPARIPGTEPLADRQVIAEAGVELVVHHQPGHTSDHVCLGVARTGVVLTGDHVLGEGTTVIAWPDGDLGAYLASLRALRGLAPTALYPGHGDVIDDPAGHIDALLAHRAQRTRQIVDALADGGRTVPEIVAQVYPDLRSDLRPAAGRSVQAHLADLVRQGRVTSRGERWHGR